ncbi:hypothetical protein V1477_002308, partial [Vespula maculifrons]
MEAKSGAMEDEAKLDYKLSGDDSIAYRPLGSPEEVFHVLLRYTILYEERSYEGVQLYTWTFDQVKRRIN